MHENGLTRFQSAHHDDKLPSREVIDRERSPFQRRHPRREGEDSLQWDAHQIRITPNRVICHGIAANPA
jgi:hypothetical protein